MAYPQVEPAPSPVPEEDRGVAVGYRCPECGRVFDRSQALGLHRRQVHGVKGKSAGAKRSASKASERPQTRTGIDARRVLRAAFPNGIPATPEAVAIARQLLDAIE